MAGGRLSRFRSITQPDNASMPCCSCAVVGTAVVGIAHGDSIRAVMLTIAFTAVTLQVGYLFGLVTRAVIASLGVPERNAVTVEKLGLR
jgi:hypothetical protein